MPIGRPRWVQLVPGHEVLDYDPVRCGAGHAEGAGLRQVALAQRGGTTLLHHEEPDMPKTLKIVLREVVGEGVWAELRISQRDIRQKSGDSTLQLAWRRHAVQATGVQELFQKLTNRDHVKGSDRPCFKDESGANHIVQGSEGHLRLEISQALQVAGQTDMGIGCTATLAITRHVA